MTHLLVAVLALSIGWCLGHRTARVRHVPVGALAEDDQAALLTLAEERRRFDELVAGLTLEIPDTDDPRSSK